MSDVGRAMTYFEQVEAAARFIRAEAPFEPEIAVVLGSGLGDFASGINGAVSMTYREIPSWPASTVVGHEGRLVVGNVGERRVAALAGRAHFYEGYDLRAVTLGVRVMGALGATVLILTNAAGGINTGFATGTLMVIDDHINLTGDNPLAGPNDERFGPRFPDMSEVYSTRLRGLAVAAGAAVGVTLAHGVYAGVKGPSYETPAEIRFLRTIGADAVGMSTVHEAIAARHVGIEVLGISCITNMAAGVLPQPLNHAEVLETTRRTAAQFSALLERIVTML